MSSTPPGAAGCDCVSSAVSFRDSTWRCAELIACPRAFQRHNDRLGLLTLYCRVDLTGRIALRSVQAVAGFQWPCCALVDHRPSAEPCPPGPSVLLPQLMANGKAESSQKMGSGAERLIGRISVGIAALPVPKYPLMCLRPLPTEAWYPPKSAIDEWLATMI